MGFINMTGGVLFSSIIKFFSYKHIILFLSMLTTSSLLILLFIPSKISVFLCLPLISISYGGIIAIFPSMIIERPPPNGGGFRLPTESRVRD